jgi:predicted amidohydrolase
VIVHNDGLAKRQCMGQTVAMSQQVNRAWTNPKRFMTQLGRTSKFERSPHPITLLVKAAFGAILGLCFSPILRADSPQTAPTVKVAAVQCSSILGGVEANRAKLSRLVEKAAGMGAKIVVLPETAITGYLSQDLKKNWHLPGKPLDPQFTGIHPGSFAETVPGPSTAQFAALAKRLKIHVTVPLMEVERKDGVVRYFNTVCLAGPDGAIIGHYRKLTPWPVPEKSWATAGDRGVAVVETEYGKVGLAICYDIHNILDLYAPHKIWALLYPIAWVDKGHPADWFWHTLPGRLGKYDHHVIGANWSVDERQSWRGYGFSTIYAAGGKVLSSAKSIYGDEIVYADLETRPAIAIPAASR